MTWQTVAGQMLGPLAPDVIQRLQAINPNYDWSGPIQQYVPALNAAYGHDWMDPSRGSSAGLVSALLQTAQADGEAWAASALPGARQAQQQQESQIQAAQNPQDDDGIGSLLGLGLAGAGMYFGVPGVSSALGSLFGGLGDVGGGVSAQIPGEFGFGDGLTDTPWGVNPRGGGMDLNGFMGADPWGASAPSAWETLAQSPLGGGGLNYGGGIDPYGLGLGAPTGTGSAGWDSVFNAGSNLPAGGPWADFTANPYGTGVPSGGITDLIKQYGQSAAKALGLANSDGSMNLGKLLGGLGGAALGSINGSKPAGTTTTVQDIPDWLKPYATNLLDQGQGIVNANKITPDTFSQSDSVLNGIMGGDSMQAPQFNPYGGMTTPQTSNQYIGQTVTPGTNMHLGENNPYFESVLTKSLNDTQGRVNNQFGNRAFGGSANQELLQRGLSDQSNAARFGEYDKQTALSEADVARRLQAQQADLARNSSLQQNQGQFNAQLYANDASRNAGIWGTDANRNQNAFQFGRNQMFNAAQASPGYNAAKTNAGFAPLTAQKGLFTSGTQTSSPYFNNPAGGALYGGLLGSQLFGGK